MIIASVIAVEFRRRTDVVTAQVVISRVHDWVAVRRRQLLARIIAVIGIFLVVNGIRSL